MLTKAYIPYGGYYSSPFCKWQGSMANENAIELGAKTSKQWLEAKNWDPGMFDYLMFGITIGQPKVFYGSTWAAHMMGAGGIPGMNISQACSTSTTSIFLAGMGIENGLYQNAYCLMTDRCSNGPHTIWPNPKGPGGEVISENWSMDNFNHDPTAHNAMIETAENVAAEAGITKEMCDAYVLRKYEQYQDAFANDSEFKHRYMFPVEVQISKKKTKLIEDDEGVAVTTREGLARLKPVRENGVHSFGTQTHPADGSCGLVVTTREKARELGRDAAVEVKVVAYGYARVKKGYMAAAVVPAVTMALKNADLTIDAIDAIKTHNPFAVNDLYLAQQLGLNADDFNNFGSSLIFGHPQAPTAGRCIIEGIEELAGRGGGYLLFGGCAAGDTAASLILKVG